MTALDLAVYTSAALSLAAALAYPFLKGESLTRSLVKTSAVLLLALCAFLQSPGQLLLPLALVLSAAGDWFLSRPGEKNFLKGMAAFAAAHLVYLWLFALILTVTGPSDWPDPRTKAIVVLGGLGSLIAFRITRAAGPLKLPVGIYCAVILAMGLTAMRLPSSALMVSLAALLFVISDALIGQQKFLRRRWPGQDLAIWALYYAAQALFAFDLYPDVITKG